MMKKRGFELLSKSLVIIGCGLLYALWIRMTGLAVPCIIHKITGLQCPGCGITRMCLAVLKLDFEEAFHQNAAVLLLLPVFTGCMVYWGIRYVRTGIRKLPKWMNILLYGAITILLLFGILRNF